MAYLLDYLLYLLDYLFHLIVMCFEWLFSTSKGAVLSGVLGRGVDVLFLVSVGLKSHLCASNPVQHLLTRGGVYVCSQLAASLAPSAVPTVQSIRGTH